MIKNRLLKFWSSILNIGVSPELEDIDRRYIKISNATAFILSIWLPTTIPPYLSVWPSSKYIIFNSILFPILWLFVLVLNYFKKYLTARFFLAYSSIICVSLNAVQMGLESDNHFFLLMVSIGSFYNNPPKHIRYIMLFSISALIAFIGVEFYLTYNGPIIIAPPNFYKIARIASLVALGALIFLLTMHNYYSINNAQAELQKEHNKSESLLLNILPPVIADRLKNGSTVIADNAKEASILFADIVGFTGLSQTMSAEKLVVLLNSLFSEFDILVAKYRLEKIKTIGDAYMIASGIPIFREDHLEALAKCAIEMQETMKRGVTPESKDLQVRIGIHSGPVVAGVIGKSKFIYDLWGDSVNTASRMESHGEAGKIQVTDEVFEKLKDQFHFSDKREVLIKGKGIMDTRFLLGIRS
jgi:adenylate cyclase